MQVTWSNLDYRKITLASVGKFIWGAWMHSAVCWNKSGEIAIHQREWCRPGVMSPLWICRRKDWFKKISGAKMNSTRWLMVSGGEGHGEVWTTSKVLAWGAEHGHCTSWHGGLRRASLSSRVVSTALNTLCWDCLWETQMEIDGSAARRKGPRWVFKLQYNICEHRSD